MKKLLFILALCLSVFASAQCPVGNLPQNAKWRFVFSQCMEDTLVIKYADTSKIAYIDGNGNLTTITYAALLDSLDVETALINPEYYSGWCASGQVPSYVSNNHTAEGKLIIKGDTIFNFFRSSAGGHVNNDGKIVLRFSLDSGITWSVPSTVYDSSGIDDRNIVAGVIGDRMVVGILRYNATLGTTIDRITIYTDDNGATWSNPQVVSSPSGNVGWFGNSFILNDSLIFVMNRQSSALGDSNESFFYISPDGSNFTQRNRTIVSIETGSLDLVEFNYVKVSEDTILCVIRNNANFQNVPYFAYSTDGGNTFSTPAVTNLSNGVYGRAPGWQGYDSTQRKVITVSTTRKEASAIGTDQVFVYVNDVSELIASATSFRLTQQFEAVYNSYLSMYGYPTGVNYAEGKWLVIYTERFIKNNTSATSGNANSFEVTTLYQFDIDYSVKQIGETCQSRYDNLVLQNGPYNDYFRRPFNRFYTTTDTNNTYSSTIGQNIFSSDDTAIVVRSQYGKVNGFITGAGALGGTRLTINGPAFITQTARNYDLFDSLTTKDDSTGEIRAWKPARLFAQKGDTNTFGNIITGSITSSSFGIFGGGNQFIIGSGQNFVYRSSTSTGTLRYISANNWSMGADAATFGLRITSTGTLSAPDASAVLQLESTTKGFLPPVMTATQASAIASPAQGLMVFVTSTNGTFTAVGWWGFDGANWVPLH